MPDWSQLGSLFDFSAVYYTTQLVRCAIFSYMLLGLVMLLRKVLFSCRTFLKGMLWTSFLLIPFLGKLKMFYENEFVINLTWRLTGAAISWIWADRMYMAGIFTVFICIFGKRLRLWRFVSGMEKASLYHTLVRVTDMNVTPFTAGLLRPRIVIPKVILENYGREELWAVLQHEKTHIRLGHLWFGFLWDILRCLLWVNPFLTIFQKQFREDLEDICDRVCIQKSGKTAQEYGMVLLKTLKLLGTESGNTPSAVTYAGEQEFKDMKRRMGKIAGFRPYKKSMCFGMTGAALLVIASAFLAVRTHSYARCNESRDIMIGNYDGKAEIISHDTGELSRMISYDDRFVYVRREAFEEFLEKNHGEGEIWIVFGGFYKLPGLAGAAEACIYERGLRDKIVRIPYESIMDNWYFELLKLL